MPCASATASKKAAAAAKPTSSTLARKPGGAPDASTATTDSAGEECSPAGVPDMTAAESFWRKLHGVDGGRFTEGDLVAVAVPSSEGWEDRDDIHWFYGFATVGNLYIRFPTTAGWDAKDLNASLLALIELGQQVCLAERVWLVVKRNPDELENLVHTLLYVGFEVDDKPEAFAVDEEHHLFLKLVL